MSATAQRVEHRRFSRIPLRRPATLEVFDRRAGAELLDISLRGARFRVPGCDLEEGQVCTATVHLGAETAITMHGVVAHCHGEVVAVHCQRTDLDSLAHLRRVLELNLGDDRMARSELATFLRR
jgi:PilZ domain